MPFLNWVEPETATGQAAEYYRVAGAAPILKCYSLRPDFGMAMAHASILFHFSHGALPRRDHEAIAAYVSALNHCPYWVDSHGAFLRSQGEKEGVVLAIFDGDLDAATAAGLEPERRAMLEFARKLTFEAYKVTQGDIDILRHYGYNDVQIAEVIYDSALFAMYNRVADGFGIGSSGMMNLPAEVVRKIAPNPE